MATETTMQAGPELDAEVRRVLGMPWRFICPKCGSTWFGSSSLGDKFEVTCHDEHSVCCSWWGSPDECPPPKFSSDPAAAWQVVEHVSRERKVWFGISYAHPALADTGMEHESCSVMVYPIGSIKPLADATAATFAEAVCRAALAAARPRT